MGTHRGQTGPLTILTENVSTYPQRGAHRTAAMRRVSVNSEQFITCPICKRNKDLMDF